ncbi:MAG: hypothetical protein JSR26_09120 [Proteobacteria bacterium]|nr:hypothetical protein [Pseudomonadota bacterium]
MPRWLWITLAALLLATALAIHSRHGEVTHAPGVLAPDDPVQIDIAHGTPFPDGDYSITPLANFSMTARVLSRADYSWDRGAALSPTDFAFGWGRMSDSSVLAGLDISQSGRWYYYQWHTPQPPIPLPEIIHTSANMHMIPADATVRGEIKQVRVGDVVHLEGLLIEARGKDGSTWRSSMSRDDTGDGACEVVYVRSLVVM